MGKWGIAAFLARAAAQLRFAKMSWHALSSQTESSTERRMIVEDKSIAPHAKTTSKIGCDAW